MVLGKYRKGGAWWIMYHMKLSCENTQNCEKSHIFSINRSISGTYGLFTCIETSDFGGASHLREILFITVKLDAHFQYQSINVIFVVYRNF